MKMQMRVTIIILYALCFLGSGIAEAQDANSYYTRGEALYKQQQYDQAIDNLGKAITLNPNYSYSYLYRGLCYYAKQQYDLAIQDYNKVLAQTPADTYTYNARGNAYYAKQQYDLAIQDYNKAVSLNPNDPYTYTVRGLAYYGKQAYEPAIQDYTKAISMNANDYYSYTMRGLVYFATKDYALSLQDYNKALSVNPNNADAVYYRGNVYFIQTFYDLAIQDFSKAISLNNNYWSVYNARGTAYYYKAQYDLAIQDYTKAIQLAPNDTYAYYYRGFTNYVKKEYDQALQDLNKVIDLNPKYTDAFNMRGLTYKSKGDYGNAVNDFVKTISLDANYTKAYINIIEPLARMYRFADVSRYYATFRSKNTIEYIDDESYNFYKKYVEAITQNLTNNNYAGALLSLKEAEELYKNKKQNKDDYQKNSFATILALKGYVLEQLNKTEEAKQAYEQALVMNTLQPEINAALQRLAQKQQIFIKNDDTPPVITILEPAAKRSFTIEDDKPGATQRIRGKAFDASGIKKLTINNLPLKIEEAGYFETTVSIKEGTNVFTVVALDNNSNSTSENVVIEGGKINEKPQPAPAVAKAIDIPALANTSAYHALLIAESDYTDNGIKNLAGTRTEFQ
jgi:tetratricopeptide (TPR) repeat protein